MGVRQFVARRLGLEISGSRVLRQRRFRMFLDLMDTVATSNGVCRILDIGGEPYYWRAMMDLFGNRRFHITVVNLDRVTFDDDRFTAIVGDARRMPEFPDMSFDIIHSNSTIEHVGLWWDMAAMAQEVRRLAPSYFVQTPYYWFPYEPHCSTAFFHWMPESVRISMLMRRPRGIWGKAATVDQAMRQIHSAILLDRRMLSALFPDAEICRERIVGVTKSLIAVRRPGLVSTSTSPGRDHATAKLPV